MSAIPALRATLESLGARALDFLFTPRCVGCRREGAYLCEPCLAQVARLEGPYRPVTDHRDDAEPLAVPLSYSPFAMKGAIRQAVHDLKYRGVRALAPLLGAAMAEHAQRSGLRADLLVPVPLHRTRLRERGYNQAELLAREVGRRMRLPVDSETLARVRHGSPQAMSGDAAERRAEVREAFQARRKLPARRVLLVDDVCTTGATLNACGRALKRTGVQQVLGLTLAREL
ncbi:MAG: ComF family protein [Dehalococcoidia bacterium]